MTKAEKKWIKDTMKKFPFVKWDRAIDYKKWGFIVVYGWIDRPKDAYKDFITLQFDLDLREKNVDKIYEVWCHSTSSTKYSKKISRILGEEHIDCINIKELNKA